MEVFAKTTFKKNRALIRSSKFLSFYKCTVSSCMEYCSKAVTQRCSVKKVFLEISQNSHENTCDSVFFNKVAGWGL